jgi:hypothetical protein
MNSKLGTRVNIYFKWTKKSQQITHLKKLADIKNITKSRKITQYVYKLTTWHTSIIRITAAK